MQAPLIIKLMYHWYWDFEIGDVNLTHLTKHLYPRNRIDETNPESPYTPLYEVWGHRNAFVHIDWGRVFEPKTAPPDGRSTCRSAEPSRARWILMIRYWRGTDLASFSLASYGCMTYFRYYSRAICKTFQLIWNTQYNVFRPLSRDVL